MTITLAKWTIDKYHSMVDAGILANRHVELLRGEIGQLPTPTPSGVAISVDAVI
ncbi:hypothetical protein NIES4071_48950 [Calothrix sp. NIES-4071]|nr:hypothetical protein NIES4071_48950 [Calothrix sp. NIES-4071]BAZ59207.1 hypothetical protein NIES4105_48890 [Calothrix sp. NIES-4105]